MKKSEHKKEARNVITDMDRVGETLITTKDLHELVDQKKSIVLLEGDIYKRLPAKVYAYYPYMRVKNDIMFCRVYKYIKIDK